MSKPTRCDATTAKGTPCRNFAKHGTRYCGAHSGSIGRPRMSPSDPYVADGVTKTYSEVVCSLAALGLRRHRIARQLRMRPATVESWLETGEAHARDDIKSDFRDFYLQYEAARVNFVTKQLKRISDAAEGTKKKPGDWRAAVKLLELIERDEFGPVHKHEHSGEITLRESHADELAELIGAILTDPELDLTPEQLDRAGDVIEYHLGRAEQKPEVW